MSHFIVRGDAVVNAQLLVESRALLPSSHDPSQQPSFSLVYPTKYHPLSLNSVPKKSLTMTSTLSSFESSALYSCYCDVVGSLAVAFTRSTGGRNLPFPYCWCCCTTSVAPVVPTYCPGAKAAKLKCHTNCKTAATNNWYSHQHVCVSTGVVTGHPFH